MPHTAAPEWQEAVLARGRTFNVFHAIMQPENLSASSELTAESFAYHDFVVFQDIGLYRYTIPGTFLE